MKEEFEKQKEEMNSISSVKLSRNTKGVTWEIKVYNTDTDVTKAQNPG